MTDYGRFVLSLTRKERKRYLEVEKALKGALISSKSQSYPVPFTTFVQLGP